MRWNEEFQEKYKAHSLFGRMLEEGRYVDGWKKVKQNQGAGGVDGMTIGMFERQEAEHIQKIIERLRNKTYEPMPVRRVEIPKPGTNKTRKLGIPSVRDRLVQQVLRDILEPYYEPHFSEHSYGYRPGRGALDAIEEVKRLRMEFTWVLEGDISGFFDHVDHEILIDLVNERVSDGSILKLIRSILKSGVMSEEGLLPSDEGTPQGGVISPLLANIYLNHLDRRLEKAGLRFVRYADDFVVFCESKEGAEKALSLVKDVLENELRLTLNPEKTRIRNILRKWDEPAPPEYGPIEFLGFEIYAWEIYPKKVSVKKFKDRIRDLTIRHQTKKTKQLMEDVSEVVRGWGNYYRIGTVGGLFRKLDSWIRMRIRLILARRSKHKVKKNRGWVWWCNRYYRNRELSELGLVSLTVLRGADPWSLGKSTRCS
jgi:RNA-directed DNA polymerase